MKRLLISRDLSTDSILYRSLSEHFDITGCSFIDFQPIPFQYPTTVFDWLFFYSKNGVRYFFEQLKDLDSFPQIAAMGSGTALAIQQLGLEATFIGEGNPKAVAEQFLAIAKNKKVLFPQAQYSKQSIQQFLSQAINSHSLVVYSNSKKKDIPPYLQEQDILVFTSPLNVEAYLEHFKIKENQIVISIGNSTSEHLKSKGISWIKQTKHPSEKDIVESIFELF